MPIDAGLVSLAAQKNKKKDPMETIMQGLQIASTVYGIKSAADQNERLQADSDLRKQEFELKKSELEGRGPREAGKLAEQRAYEASVLKQKQDFEAQQNLLNRQNAANLKKIEAANQAAIGKTLPAATAESFGDAEASKLALQNAQNQFVSNKDIAGPIAGRAAGLQGMLEIGDAGKRAKVFDAQLKINAQSIGKYLEGGKLTDADIDRYKQMLPNISDSPDVAEKKTQLLQNLITQKQQAQVQSLQQAGYNVKNISLKDFVAKQAGGQMPEKNTVTAGSMPRRVIQNGNQFILDEKTGEYKLDKSGK